MTARAAGKRSIIPADVGWLAFIGATPHNFMDADAIVVVGMDRATQCGRRHVDCPVVAVPQRGLARPSGVAALS